MKKIKQMVAAIICAFVATANAADWTMTVPEDMTNEAITVISDGNWKINVYIRNAEARELGLGTKSGNLNAFVKEDNKYVGEGELDFRKPVYEEGGDNRWTITSLGKHSFGNAFTDIPAATIYFPEELTQLGIDATAEIFKGVTMHGFVSIVSTNHFNIIYNNTFLQSHVKNLLLQLPNLKAIGGHDFEPDFLVNTDVSNWDLSSVENIAVNNWDQMKEWEGEDSNFINNPNRTFFRNKKFSGTLRLPSLKRLKRRMFENCANMNALEVGTNLSLVDAASNTVLGCTSLGSITLGGASADWTIAENAFNAPNITNVTFLSYPAVMPKTGLAFGTAETPARSIVFCIPKKQEYEKYWMTHKLFVRTLTESEKAEFAEKYGTRMAENVIGIVPAIAFCTAKEQYLAYDVPERPKLSVVENDSRWNDSFIIRPEPDEDGAYEYGTQITVTPKGADERTTFGRWYGAPEGLETQTPLVFEIKDDTQLRGVFHHGWTFETETNDAEIAKGTMGTIHNGIWKLNVYVADVEKGELYIGNGLMGWNNSKQKTGCGWTGIGSGELDMNGIVNQYDDEGKFLRNWTIAGLSTVSLQMNNTARSNSGQETWPVSVIFPETLTKWGMQPLRSEDGHSALTSLVIRLPNYTGNIENDNLVKHEYDNLEIEIPQMKYLGGGAFGMNSTVDVTSWRLDAVTSFKVEPNTAWNNTFREKKFSGVLHLPSISEIIDKSFLGCSNMSGIDLGSNTVVKSIGAQAFANCSSLVRFKISSDKDLQVAEDAFSGASELKCIEFGGSVPPSDTTVIDNILAGVPDEFADNELPCVIYASRLRGWDKLATPAATDEDAQAEMKYAPLVAKESDLIGVYQTADGKRKAWIVHRASDKDPKGTILIIR